MTASGAPNMSVQRFWYQHSPQVLLGELLEKRWMEAFVPFVIMLGTVALMWAMVPGFITSTSLFYLLRDFSPGAFVAAAMAITIISGGMDLSVGAVFAMANFIAIYMLGVAEFPLPVMLVGVLGFGAVIGSINGLLIAYVRTRPFLTTIVILIIVRAAYDLLIAAHTSDLAGVAIDDPSWSELGFGSLLHLPVSFLLLLSFAVLAHFYLTRLRPGLHLMAVGSSRRAARHAGINVKLTILSVYIISGCLAAFAGLLYAARQNSVGSGVGVGWEVNALAAGMLGGISLSGGRGSITRALMGAVTIFVLTNGLVQMGLYGALTSAVVGGIVLAAVAFNVKWAKNKAKITQKVYVAPTWVDFKPADSVARGSLSPFAENDRLLGAEAIGLDQIEGPEDVILDEQDRLYAVTRNGSIVRFSGENFSRRELFARIGGRPLGMSFDRDQNLIVCVAGMGLYGVRPNGSVFKLTDETNRTWFKLKDDSRLSLADDLDIAPDGKIYFSEATLRYDAGNWPLDGLEGRGNGRIICFDPAKNTTRTIIRNQVFPNGVCVSHDGKSFLFCSSWLCKIYRYWIDTEKKGTLEVLVDNLPGYPDNLNRSSDGNYWVALVGMRARVYDVAMSEPGFRTRMIKQIPRDEWLIPGLNYGAIVKISDTGKAIESLWDPTRENHPSITSMREHKGYLYIAGLENNRIGRIRLDGANPLWTGWGSYWGTSSPGLRERQSTGRVAHVAHS
jgi:ribose transport system permease protein